MTADLGDRQDADALGQRIRPVAASLRARVVLPDWRGPRIPVTGKAAMRSRIADWSVGWSIMATKIIIYP
jgi:hypothetical protein